MAFHSLSIFIHMYVSVVSFSYVRMVIFIQIIFRLLKFGTIKKASSPAKSAQPSPSEEGNWGKFSIALATRCFDKNEGL